MVAPSVKGSFTFVGGLNTEGGYFITPDNSWKDGVNVVPNMDGTLQRRKGLDYEPFYQLFDSAITADQKNLWAFTVGNWSTVGGNGNLNFFVVQTGYTLSFYDSLSGSVSSTRKSFTIDLRSYKATGTTAIDGTDVASFASTYGRLIVTTASTNPILIEYTASSDTITVSTITVSIRDFEGFESPLAVDQERTEAEWTALTPTFLTQAKYNLYNQGWTDALITTYKTANANKLPANSKNWISGKNTTDDFDAALLNKQDFGTSPAPKGRTILNAFYQDRSSIIYSTAYRPKVCAFFAGRAWYAGMGSAKELGTVYFSQVLDVISNVGKCYQQNDPTSEVFSDLLDSDGGTIQIPEAGEIIGLQPLGRGMAVLASNGVWFISGLDTAFTAANYSVSRVSNVGCNSAKSIAAIEDSLLYWSNTGIYTLSPGVTAAEFSSQNISDKNIKTFYQNIPTLNKVYAEVSYNVSNKLIYWLYSKTDTSSTSSGRYNKTSILALDVKLNAWYWHDFDTSLGVIPVSLEVTKETTESSAVYDVLVGTSEVQVSTDDVIATLSVINGTVQQFKVMALHPVTSNNYSVTFADFENVRTTTTKFKDWYSYNNAGVESNAYFITGYDMGAVGPARVKTAQYITTFMKRTETSFDANTNPINESGCLMQTRWDFTDNTYAGKWQAEVEVYRQLRPYFAEPLTTFDDGYPLVVNKNKVRGRGKALQLKFSSEAGKDMQMVGWTTTILGNQNV
jgi:hypothetical protein